MHQTRKNILPAEVRVGLVLQTGQALMRDICRGVYRFLVANRHWHIEGDGPYPLLQWEQLGTWKGDGLIGIANDAEQLELMIASQVPFVNVGSRIVDPRVSTVACDNAAIGRIAAEHLLSRGLRNFLYVSELKWENERIRHEAFAAAITEAGFQCKLLPLAVHETITADASARYHPDLKQLTTGLQEIEKPVGVCAPNSVLARIIVETAQSLGHKVPDDVAVLGVNDDPLICESTNPHLSAVVQPAEQIGMAAAEQLDRLMCTECIEPRTTYLPPRGVACRQSTDMLAIKDEDVRAALRFLREHAHEPIDVADVATELAISRRTLETKFQKLIGRTPALELRRVRLEHSKRLLAETSDSITKVVFASGFNSRQVFSSLFRREFGLTPSEYRRQFQIEVLA